MEKEKNNKGLIATLTIIIVILAALCILFATGTISLNRNIKEDNNKISETNSNEKVVQEKTVEETIDENGNTNISIKYTGETIDLDKYITGFREKEENKGKMLNITISDINLDNKDHTYKIENYTDCLRLIEKQAYSEDYNNFYIDDVKIEHLGNQACYLSGVDKLFVIKNKYIGIFTHSQAGNFITIYDSNAKIVDIIDLIDYEFNNDEITYHSYENEKGCYIETYLYTLKDNKGTKEFKNKEKNTQCNEMNGKGCSYQCGE